MHRLPHDSLSLDSLDEQLLQPGVKGLPITAPLRQGAIGLQGWNVLRAETSFPVAVLKHSALVHNLAWMKDFCARHGAILAPHGKTTMSPQLFGAQLANGAWGITLANATQVRLAHRYGVRRVLMANQLVAPADIASMLDLLHDDPGFELFVLVDSDAGIARLQDAVATHPLARPLPLLVELGMQGKRAGCRSDEAALALAHAVARAPGLQLAGFEGYEGLQVTEDRAGDIAAVAAFLDRLAGLARQADADQLFMGRSNILLTAGGSGYFDLVARRFHGIDELSRPVLPILRSGCYLTSDHGSYLRQIGALNHREACCGHSHHDDDGLRPALEVWSMVQSCPEPGLAILTMGKRDASYDIDLPIPLQWHRPGAAAPQDPQDLPEGSSIFKMNDQHAYLRLPAGSEALLEVGDLIGCGISHPCTTFDKWPLLLAVDDDYTVTYAINTCF